MRDMGSKATTPALAATALAAAFALGACNNPTATTREEAPPAVATSSATIRPSVSWPAASTLDERALTAIASESKRLEDVRALVSRSPVPVLAPKSLRLASPTLVVEGEYFALTGRADGATISLQGTRAAHRYEGVEPVAGNRELRGTRGFVSVNEGIRTASWIENGAAYSVDVECASADDARCQSEGFLLSVVAELTFVGGSGR